MSCAKSKSGDSIPLFSIVSAAIELLFFSITESVLCSDRAGVGMSWSEWSQWLDSMNRLVLRRLADFGPIRHSAAAFFGDFSASAILLGIVSGLALLRDVIQSVICPLAAIFTMDFGARMRKGREEMGESSAIVFLMSRNFIGLGRRSGSFGSLGSSFFMSA